MKKDVCARGKTENLISKSFFFNFISLSPSLLYLKFHDVSFDPSNRCKCVALRFIWNMVFVWKGGSIQMLWSLEFLYWIWVLWNRALKSSVAEMMSMTSYKNCFVLEFRIIFRMNKSDLIFVWTEYSPEPWAFMCPNEYYNLAFREFNLSTSDSTRTRRFRSFNLIFVWQLWPRWIWILKIHDFL